MQEKAIEGPGDSNAKTEYNHILEKQSVCPFALIRFDLIAFN